jgi:hypothetical protein
LFCFQEVFEHDLHSLRQIQAVILAIFWQFSCSLLDITEQASGDTIQAVFNYNSGNIKQFIKTNEHFFLDSTYSGSINLQLRQYSGSVLGRTEQASLDSIQAVFSYNSGNIQAVY